MPRAKSKLQSVDVTKIPAATVPCIEFPCFQGIQGGTLFWTTNVRVSRLNKIFTFDPSKAVPLERGQRSLNVARVRKIANYIINNPTSYVFPSLTATVDADVEFIEGDISGFGTLRVPIDCLIAIADGQHRLNAFRLALQLKPKQLQDDEIAVVFFMTGTLRRRCQIFLDLNQYTVKPSKSVTGAFDYRDPVADQVRALMKRSPFYQKFTTIDAGTISLQSSYLFTFASLLEADNQY